MTEKEFNLLTHLLQHPFENQRKTADAVHMSLGSVNALFNALKESGLLDEGNAVTDAGKAALAPYKVRNAVIMAAGFASRFAPLSYEKPKGLLTVKGEVMIERQIRQLQEAGITDITVITGYMKEQFFYLEDKCHVKIIVNEDYFKYNNPATLMCAIDRLGNTYICSSDNYFPENVFEPYVYHAYYSGQENPGNTKEYHMYTAPNGRIKKINWCVDKGVCFMIGHVYFSDDFCKDFVPLLKDKFENDPSCRYELWEDLLAKNIKDLEIYLREYPHDAIYEFDTLDELREFDERYFDNADSAILSNISAALFCHEHDITDFTSIKEGITNTSFKFTCNGEDYVYRHPGRGTEEYINRESEAFSMRLAKDLELDDTFLYMDPEKGWKVSKYVKDARHPDFNQAEDVELALSLMRKLHRQKAVSKYDFDHFKEIDKLVHEIAIKGAERFPDFHMLYDETMQLKTLVEHDNRPKQFCHCDCYRDNFLIDPNGKGYLIDWEYSGNSDPSADIATFISCSEYSYEEALNVIRRYYEDDTLTEQDLRHDIAYVAITSFYWFVWAIYQTGRDKVIGSSLYRWYRNVKLYGEKARSIFAITTQVC